MRRLRELRERVTGFEPKVATPLSPLPKPSFPKPKLRLEVEDLSHPGTQVFFANSDTLTALSKAVEAVLSILYDRTSFKDRVPPIRSITLYLLPMGGVAYTNGLDIDDDHKKITLSLEYIHSVSKRPKQPEQLGAEIQGVLVHEMVHCWQWNGLGTAPGGLIEGIADFVRLKAGFSPAHWKKETGGREWDAGYQVTGYFLEWIDSKFGEGSIRRLNLALQKKKYEESKFWNDLFGREVEDLWKEYSSSLKRETEREEQEEKAESNPSSNRQEGSDL